MSNYQDSVGGLIRLDGPPGVQVRAPQDAVWWDRLLRAVETSHESTEIRPLVATRVLLPWFLRDARIVDMVRRFYGVDSDSHWPTFHLTSKPSRWAQPPAAARSDGAVTCPLISEPVGRYLAGNYWFNTVIQCRELWEGLQQAGNRGWFLFEFDSESSIERGNFDYALPGGHSFYVIAVRLEDDPDYPVTAWRVFDDREYYRANRRNASDEFTPTGMLERFGADIFEYVRTTAAREPLVMWERFEDLWTG